MYVHTWYLHTLLYAACAHARTHTHTLARAHTHVSDVFHTDVFYEHSTPVCMVGCHSNFSLSLTAAKHHLCSLGEDL